MLTTVIVAQFGIKLPKPISVNISSGNEYASFYDENDELLGKSFNGTFSEFQNIILFQDSMYSDSVEKYIVVEGNWAGITKTDSMRIITQQGEFLGSDEDKDTIVSGQQIGIGVYPNDLGCNVFIPEETTYNAEIIRGNEFGNLLDPNTNEPVQNFTGLYHWFGYAYFDYLADGTPVDSVDSVTIRISMSDPKVPYKDLVLYIKPSPLVVTVEPEFVAPGDTAKLIIKKLNDDGTLTDYDSLQTFEVGMLDGCALGMIKTETDSGAYVYGVMQPIIFLADANADTGTVKLRVGLIEGGGSSRSIRDTDYGKNEEIDKSNKKKEMRIAFNKMMKEKQSNQPSFSPENTESCWGGIALTTIHKKINLPIIKLIIIYPTPYTNEGITSEPRMPEVKCRAKLSSFYPGVIKYEWKYIVRKFYKRTGGLCMRISRSEFQGKSYSNFGGEITEWNVPFDVDSGYFYFKSLRHKQNERYPKEGYGCDAELFRWYDTNEEIFTGGDVIISLTAKEYNTGKVLAKIDTIHLNKILGLNPSEEDVYLQAGDNEVIAILKYESKSHFNLSGNPTYGPPNGFGRMQLDDPASTERQMWNWKDNIEAGKGLYFNDKKPSAQSYLNKHGSSTYDNDILNPK